MPVGACYLSRQHFPAPTALPSDVLQLPVLEASHEAPPTLTSPCSNDMQVKAEE